MFQNKQKVFAIVITAALLAVAGCRTEYYEPTQMNQTKVDGKIYGPVKSEGWGPGWSNGLGKNLPLANPSFSVIGK
jgi:hypothetical protein